MTKLVDMCCDCANGCGGCGRKRVPMPFCDVCGEMFGDTIPGDVYDVDGEEICEECLKERFKR